jgi:hypothetical protein
MLPWVVFHSCAQSAVSICLRPRESNRRTKSSRLSANDGFAITCWICGIMLLEWSLNSPSGVECSGVEWSHSHCKLCCCCSFGGPWAYHFVVTWHHGARWYPISSTQTLPTPIKLHMAFSFRICGALGEGKPPPIHWFLVGWLQPCL